MEGILVSIKKMLGIPEDYDHFDADITMHINTAFMVLAQLGVGPSGFTVDEYTTWSDYIPEGKNYESIKTYIGMRVRLLFDPPSSSIVMECMNRAIHEFEWRLNSEADYGEEETDDSDELY